MRAKVITSDTQIATTSINIWGVVVYPAAGTAGTVVLYDEADSSKTSGKEVFAARCPYAATETASKEVMFTRPLFCKAGLYADIAGSGATVFIYID